MPAIVAAGGGRAAKAVYGDNKAHLELAGRSLVGHAVAALQRVPEVSEVWVVGDAARLEATLTRELAGELCKPLTVVPEFRNLLENAWETYRRLLPGAGPAGRDPTPDERENLVLFLSSDVPLATPQEISAFIKEGAAQEVDYSLGLVSEESMQPFYPEVGSPGEAGKPGIEMAYFNLREGRMRQSNLHLARPPKLGKRQHIEELYEHRYQKQLGNALALAWRIFWDEGGGLRVLFYYSLMHLAGVFDRRRWRWLADRFRNWVTIERVERALGALLKARIRVVITEGGGCAVDVDNERDFDVMQERWDDWHARQQKTVEALYGTALLPERATEFEVRRWQGGGEDST
ncbi:MAG: NTP transferase domain-containing protein [bacterium]|nr:NTP transferase domain-containing protein [bacterium]